MCRFVGCSLKGTKRLWCFFKQPSHKRHQRTLLGQQIQKGYHHVKGYFCVLGQRRHSILRQDCQKTHTHTHIQIPCGPTLRPSKAKDFQVDFSACGRSDPSWCPASFCLGPFGGHHVSTDLSHLATYNSKSDLGFARAYQPKRASSFLERHYLNTEPIMTFRDVSCKPRFRPTSLVAFACLLQSEFAVVSRHPCQLHFADLQLELCSVSLYP